jgi:hypothetical protein
MTADSEARQRLRAVAQAIGGLRPDDVEDDVLRFALDRCAPAAFSALRGLSGGYAKAQVLPHGSQNVTLVARLVLDLG